MSRSLGGALRKTDDDPLRRWNGKSRDIKFALTYETSNLIVPIVKDETDEVICWQGSSNEQSWSPTSDDLYANFNLERCLVERVTCKLYGPTDSVVSMCPSVRMYLGKTRKLLESEVRNAPCGCPLHDSPSKDTVIHEWNLTPDDRERCKEFGNFTADNLARLNLSRDRDGVVTLPDVLAGLAAKHYQNSLSVTEKGRNFRGMDAFSTVSEESFDKLRPIFLEEVSDVQPHFYDLRDIAVELNIDATCEKEKINPNQTVTLIVCVRAWCEENRTTE